MGSVRATAAASSGRAMHKLDRNSCNAALGARTLSQDIGELSWEPQLCSRDLLSHKIEVELDVFSLS
jgi:hypothetical protein